MASQKMSNNNIDFVADKTDKKEWTIKDFDIGKELGRGTYGKVYLAKVKNTDFMVAIKVLNKQKLWNGKMEHYLASEVRILSNIRYQIKNFS